ncbi:monovalent cation/H+ antiporter complex subunit F [Saccharothrix isguenensis]
MTVVYAMTLALLSVAALLVLPRLLRGPTALDRIVAVDVLVVLIVAASAVGMVPQGSGAVIPLLVAVVLLGFVGSVAAARLVEHREDEE